MKFLKSIKLILLLFLLSVTLLSCNTDSNITDETTDDLSAIVGDPIFIEGKTGMGGIIDGDIYYYLDHSSGAALRYYDLTDIAAGSYPVNTDVLKDEIDYQRPDCVLGGFYALSPELTAENGGIPVFVIARVYRSDSMELYIYDTSDNSVERIIIFEGSGMQSMSLYGDTVVFTINNGDRGWSMHRVDMDGENYIEYKGRGKEQYRVASIYNDRIYYVDERTRRLYSSSLTFEDEKEHFFTDTYQFSPFIVDGYIYYANVITNTVRYNERSYISYDLCRRPIDEIDDTSKEELFLENVASVVLTNGKLVYRYREPYHITDKNIGTAPYHMSYSFETGEATKLYDVSGTTKYRTWQTVCGDYVIFIEIDYSTGDTPQTRTDTTIVHNLATGEETVLPKE